MISIVQLSDAIEVNDITQANKVSYLLVRHFIEELNVQSSIENFNILTRILEETA